MKERTVSFLIFLLMLAIAFSAGRHSARPQTVTVETRDTVTLWDTVRVDTPVYLTERIVEQIYVPVTDTLMLHDTTYVALPRTQREYQDSLYHAWVSGYQPALDSISVFGRTEIHTVTIREKEKPKRWGIGLQAGMGLTTADGKVVTAPYVGVGLTYSLLSF